MRIITYMQTNPRHTMTLYIGPDGWWQVRCTDPEVRRLFGTDVLPVNYKGHVPAARVLAEIARINPDREVTVHPAFA